MSTHEGFDARVDTEDNQITKGKREKALLKLRVVFPTVIRYGIVNGGAGIAFSSVLFGIIPEKTGKIVVSVVGGLMGAGYFYVRQWGWYIPFT